MNRRIYVNPDAADRDAAVLLSNVRIRWQTFEVGMKLDTRGTFFDIGMENLEMFHNHKRLYVWVEDGDEVHHFDAIFGNSSWSTRGNRQQFVVNGSVDTTKVEDDG